MIPVIKFSLVIPTYNRSSLLREAVESVIGQKYNEWELIVVDDGGTDNSEEIVRGFKDDRIIYIRQENKERGAARNTGIKNASGDYITFLDSDDRLLPGYFSTALKMIGKDKYPEVFALSYAIETPSGRKNIIHEGIINERLIYGNPLSCTAVFLKKEIALKYLFSENRTLSGLEDWELWLRLAADHEIKTDKDIIAVMREHENRSVNNSGTESLEKKFEAFRQTILNNNKVVRFINNRMKIFNCGCYTYMSLHMAIAGDKKNSIRYLKKGLKANPLFIFKRRFAAIVKHLLK